MKLSRIYRQWKYFEWKGRHSREERSWGPPNSILWTTQNSLEATFMEIAFHSLRRCTSSCMIITEESEREGERRSKKRKKQQQKVFISARPFNEFISESQSWALPNTARKKNSRASGIFFILENFIFFLFSPLLFKNIVCCRDETKPWNFVLTSAFRSIGCPAATRGTKEEEFFACVHQTHTHRGKSLKGGMHTGWLWVSFIKFFKWNDLMPLYLGFTLLWRFSNYARLLAHILHTQSHCRSAFLLYTPVIISCAWLICENSAGPDCYKSRLAILPGKRPFKRDKLKRCGCRFSLKRGFEKNDTIKINKMPEVLERP